MSLWSILLQNPAPGGWLLWAQGQQPLYNSLSVTSYGQGLGGGSFYLPRLWGVLISTLSYRILKNALRDVSGLKGKELQRRAQCLGNFFYSLVWINHMQKENRKKRKFVVRLRVFLLGVQGEWNLSWTKSNFNSSLKPWSTDILQS